MCCWIACRKPLKWFYLRLRVAEIWWMKFEVIVQNMPAFSGMQTDCELLTKWSQTLPVFWIFSTNFEIMLWKGILLWPSTWNRCINLHWNWATDLHSANDVTADTRYTIIQFSMLTHNYECTVRCSCIGQQTAKSPFFHFI